MQISTIRGFQYAPATIPDVDFNGLQLYTDTRIAASITQPSTDVTVHSDLTTNGNDWAGVGAAGPRSGLETINGENAFTYVGASNEYMTLGAETLGNTGLFCDPGEQFTVMIVCESAIGASGTVISRADSSDRMFQIYMAGADVTVKLRGSTDIPGTLGDNVPGIITVRWDGSIAHGFVNTTTPFVLTPSTNAEDIGEDITLGCRSLGSGGPSFTFDGKIGATLIYDIAISGAVLAYNFGILSDIWLP